MERVDLVREPHAERQRWRNGGEWDEDAAKVALGQLVNDGRWYVRCYGATVTGGSLAYAGPRAEYYARATARRWMRAIGGDWVEAG